jgi:hypothetical protein
VAVGNTSYRRKVLVTVLLVISIFVTNETPLFKTSVIAFLVHGLDGWEQNELDVQRPETVEKLTHLSEGMVVKFAQNDDRVLKIVRDNGNS